MKRPDVTKPVGHATATGELLAICASFRDAFNRHIGWRARARIGLARLPKLPLATGELSTRVKL